jgi:hemerythrin superfamily protein
MKESMPGRRSGSARPTGVTNPIAMLKEDHRKVKELFQKFESSDDEAMQMRLARMALKELKTHSALEEEIFYPRVEGMIEDVRAVSEAIEAHHVIHFLIDELEGGGLGSEVFHAKFRVLAEIVRHHIEDEENRMMPMIEADAAELREMAARMAVRKEDLEEEPMVVNRKSAGGLARRRPQGSHRLPNGSSVKRPNGGRGGSKPGMGRNRHY